MLIDIWLSKTVVKVRSRNIDNVRRRMLYDKVLNALKQNIDKKKVKRSKVVLINSYFNRRMQRLILKRWTIGIERANQSDISLGYKKIYF